MRRAAMVPLLAVIFPTVASQLEVCPDDARILKDLPGYGWDNLENSVRLTVFKKDFSVCDMTQDKTFRTPINVDIHQKRDSNIKFTSKAFTTSDKFQSATSWGVNAEAGGGAFGWKISGSFSYGHQENKEEQATANSVTLRNEYRYKLFTAIRDPYSEVTDLLKKRVTATGKLYEVDPFRADLMVEEFVRDYGTHLITSVDYGAILFLDDKIDRKSFVDMTSHGDSYTYGVKVSGPFASVSVGGDHKSSASKTKSYEDAKRGSTVQTHGGEVQTSLNVTNWLLSVPIKPVTIDRSGIPIQSIFTELNFPDVPAATLLKIRQKTEDVINKYYAVNTYHGCMDPTNPSTFDYKANVNDKSCDDPNNHFSFGGFFQEGETRDGPVNIVNPLTGDYSCPKDFQPTMLAKHREEKTIKHCSSDCCWGACWFGHKWTTSSWKTVTTTWCHSKIKTSEDGWAFGGFLSVLRDHPRTGKKKCPEHYLQQDFYPFKLCSAPHNPQTRLSALPFGGFYSCKTSNPFSGGQHCPANYTSILVTVTDSSCAVYYCTQLQEAGETPRIIRPPFTDRVKIQSTLISRAMRAEEEIGSYWTTVVIGGGAFLVLMTVAVVAVAAYMKKRRGGQLYARMEQAEVTEGSALLRPASEEGQAAEDPVRRRAGGGLV